jgi:acetylornithine/succinyldiaminopimelate/putrescine aminotransferase
VLILGSGEKSIRFRPALNISKDILDKGLKVIRNVLYLMGTNN